MTFSDAHERNIDSKSRLQIPSQYREALELASHGLALYLVPGSRPGTLSFYPETEFESLVRHMDNEPIPDEDAHTFQQMFYSLASRLEMDKQGRVVLPDRLLKRAGISSEVVLTGVGNHFDVWNKADYDAFIDRNWGRWIDIQRQARAASRKDADNS